MKIHYCDNYQEMSQLSCDLIIADLKKNPRKLICAATGNSPTLMYKKIVNQYDTNHNIFKELSVVKLDEWGGINKNDENSCETYIHNNIITPLNISSDHFISFESNPDSPEKECDKIQKELRVKGPIDICVLGLGKNGHLGFNEPAEVLTPNCHVANLSQSSLQHQMAGIMKDKPAYGLTLGMANILHSKQIILLVTGPDKEKVVEQFLTQKITSYLPASFLWLHTNVDCYIDSEYF